MSEAKVGIENAGFKYKSLMENSRYVWVEDANNIIGRKPAHYEFIFRGGTLFLELHFEDKKSKALFHELIENLPTQLEWFDWNDSKSIKHKKSYSLDDYEIVVRIIEDLIEFDNLIGDRVRAILINDLRKYWIYAPGKNAELWDEFYEQGIMGLGWDELGDLNDYSSKEELKTKLQELEKTTGSKKNDSTANFEFKDVISIGDVIISKKGRGELLGYGIVTSDYYYDKERTRFQKCRKVNWEKKGNWKTDHKLALKTLTDITKFLPEHADYNTYYERLLGIMGQNNQTKKLEDMNIPLNIILYGHPGTGKTYRLKNEFFEKFTDKNANQTEEEYLQELVSNYSWWEVIAASLYYLKTAKVLNISEHPFLKAKVAVSSNNNVRATLWGTLQAHTIEECEHVNYTNRQAPLIFNKNENSVWEIIEANLESEAPEIIELVAKSKDFNPVTTKKKRYVFTTFHQ